MKTVVGLFIGLLIGGQQPVNVAGKWNVSIAEHAELAIVLEIEQDGNKLTANFMIPNHGDLEMVGEIVEGRISLKSTENAFAQMTLTGRIGEDGALTGHASSQMGEMTWTATKASAR